MPASTRRVLAAAAGAAAILSLAGPVTAATAAPARPAAHAAHTTHAVRAARPGRTGPAITLDSGVVLSGYDAATDAAGTTFIGWIGNHDTATPKRTIYLCTLPRGASRCAAASPPPRRSARTPRSA